MKTIVLTPKKWRTILSTLHEEHPPSTFMIRDRMKSRLGFTVREHRELIDYEGLWDDTITIRLDFYSENKRTMFLLKFSELIQ